MPLPPLSFLHLLPKAGFSRPITSTVLPHTLTGTCTGTCTVLPEPTPGEPTAAPSAEVSANAYPPDAARMPDAAAITSTLLLKAFRIGALS
ncbi:hypothetical protein EAO76_35010 [Streptomyces sp. sk2.1]|nr:hypothetical protein EAO76_35010 [Streptomyces sp. sk2.1]